MAIIDEMVMIREYQKEESKQHKTNNKLKKNLNKTRKIEFGDKSKNTLERMINNCDNQVKFEDMLSD